MTSTISALFSDPVIVITGKLVVFLCVLVCICTPALCIYTM
jgi:hypothetical protein